MKSTCDTVESSRKEAAFALLPDTCPEVKSESIKEIRLFSVLTDQMYISQGLQDHMCSHLLLELDAA
jgi:hypothetical protein